MRLAAFALTLCLIAPAARAETATLSGAPALLQKAKELDSKGELLKAREIYEKILSQKKSKDLVRAYENLTVRILLAPVLSREKKLHKVAEGETLLGIASKYKMSLEHLKKNNGLKSDIIHPGMKLNVVPGPFSIKVDKSDNILVLLLNGKKLKHYRVATGARNITPTGHFRIAEKVKNPTWYKGKKVIPPGTAANHLGTRWLGFDSPSYGIHGTHQPETIGRQVSSGCVRMINREVEELYTLLPIGAKVTIVN